MRRWLKARFPTAESLRQNRWLKPLAPALSHPQLWHFNRRTVAGGVAVGVFFGLLIPVAQILSAAVAAICFRVNLPVAAMSTLVTNPFTFPPVYYLAYRIGVAVTGLREGAEVLLEEGAEIVHQGGWLESALGIGKPLVVGLLILATAGAAAGYFLVHQTWRWLTLFRLARKRRSRGESA